MLEDSKKDEGQRRERTDKVLCIGTVCASKKKPLICTDDLIHSQSDSKTVFADCHIPLLKAAVLPSSMTLYLFGIRLGL